MSDRDKPEREALRYEPSRVAWGTADYIRQPPHAAVFAFAIFLGVALVVGGVYTSVTRIPINITVAGRLVSESQSYEIVAQNSAHLTKVLVSENAEVHVGDTLIETDDQLSEADRQTIQDQIAALRQVLVDDRNRQCGDACAKVLTRFAVAGFKVKASSPLREALSQTLEQVQDVVRIRNAERNSGGSLAELYRQIRTARAKMDVIKQKHAEALLSNEMESLQAQIGAANAQIAERRSTTAGQTSAALDHLDLRLARLKDEVEDFFKSRRYLAPIDGVVTTVALSGPGQQLTPGAHLFAVVPKDSKLVAEVSVANRDIARIGLGLPAHVRIDALPEREYGHVNGQISSIPPAAESLNNYKIRISLDKQALVANGRRQDFKLGMTLSALIVLRRDRLITIGLKHLMNIQDEVMSK